MTNMEIDRSTYIGGGDAAAILNLSPWRSAADLWLSKTGRHKVDVDSPAIYWGNRLEALVAEEYTIRTGRTVRRHRNIIRHPEHSFIGGHIDRRVVGEPGIVEVKTTNQRWENGEVPVYYKLQGLHYLAVTGAHYCDFAVLNLQNREFWVERLEVDREAIAALLDAELRFWHDHVVADIPPPLDYTREETRRVLDRMHAGTSGESIVIPGDLHEAAWEYAALTDQIRPLEAEVRKLKKQRTEHENRIREAMGDAAKMISDVGTFTRSWIKEREVSYTAQAYSRLSFKPTKTEDNNE